MRRIPDALRNVADTHSLASARLADEAVDMLQKSFSLKLLRAKDLLTSFDAGTGTGLSSAHKTGLIDGLARGVGPKAALSAYILGSLKGWAANRKATDATVRDMISSFRNPTVVKTASYAIELVDMREPIGLEKNASANTAARDEVRSIMQRIYNEDPSYWPYGLDIPGHESVYLIRDNMTKAAAGFVGWQQHRKGGKMVGSYSIGILPEYRNKGFAKEAVAKIIREKAAGVDEVTAYICSHNARSKGLARSVHVPITENF